MNASSRLKYCSVGFRPFHDESSAGSRCSLAFLPEPRTTPSPARAKQQIELLKIRKALKLRPLKPHGQGRVHAPIEIVEDVDRQQVELPWARDIAGADEVQQDLKIMHDWTGFSAID